MTKQIALLMAAMVLATPGWTKDRSVAADKNAAPKEESIGVGSGAVVGAAAGGPIGAIIGAALGGWAGDKFHRERKQRKDAEDRYARASTDLRTIEELLHGSEREITALQSDLSSERLRFRTAMERALEVEVFFLTAQAALDEDTEERLMRVGEAMLSLDDFSVIIEGHADSRGDEDYNEQLSAQRAAAVRDTLIRAGVPAYRITSRAVGESESVAAENDLDALALERRVSMSLVQPDTGNRVAQQ